MANSIREKLAAGKAIVGTMAGLDLPAANKAVAESGFDFVLIDTQHSAIDPTMLSRMVRAMGHKDVIVRVLFNEPWLINQALDIGADGVIVPLTESAADVERAIEAAKYPPRGNRSWGSSLRADKYGGSPGYSRVANDETLVWPQIESVKAVERLDEILTVEGIDGIMVGPGDLGLTMGILPSEWNDEHDAMIRHILDKCNEHGVPWGMFTSTYEIAERWLERGGLIATVGADLGFLMSGLAAMDSQVRDLVARVNTK